MQKSHGIDDFDFLCLYKNKLKWAIN